MFKLKALATYNIAAPTCFSETYTQPALRRLPECKITEFWENAQHSISGTTTPQAHKAHARAHARAHTRAHARAHARAHTRAHARARPHRPNPNRPNRPNPNRANYRC
jgi:hypothetical protein